MSVWLTDRPDDDDVRDCTHRRSERCLVIGEIWYRICSGCGAKADGSRVAPRNTKAGDGGFGVPHLTGLVDSLLIDP